MFEPELYNNAHKKVKAIAGQIIKKHFSTVKWRADGTDTLMDIGTGSGDVLMDYILPMMPDNLGKLICSDISSVMLEFLRTHYGNPKKFEYHIMDITSSTAIPEDLKETIDHLTSIYVLHMVQDFSTAVKNMYNLMRPGGSDCLIVFMPSNSIFESYNYLRTCTKWIDYKQIIESCIPPLFYSANPKTDFEKHLKNAGFKEFSVETSFEICSYDSFENFKDGLKSVCVILKSIPTPNLRTEFLDDFVAAVIDFSSRRKKSHQIDATYYACFDLIIANAKKF